MLYDTRGKAVVESCVALKNDNWRKPLVKGLEHGTVVDPKGTPLASTCHLGTKFSLRVGAPKSRIRPSGGIGQILSKKAEFMGESTMQKDLVLLIQFVDLL